MPKLRGSDSTALKGSYKRRKTARQRAVEVLTQSNRKGRIPAFWYENGWFRDRNRTQPWVYPQDLEQQVQWVDDLTGLPRGWSLGADLLGGAGSFSSAAGWSLGGGWSITGGQLVATSATGTSATFSLTSLVPGTVYAVRFTVLSRSGGAVTPRFIGGTSVSGSTIATSGTFCSYLTANTGNVIFSFLASPGTTLVLDDLTVQEVILDTSWLGPNLVTNGDFSNGTTGWNAEPGWSISSGSASYSASSTTSYGNIYQHVPVVAGKVYAFSVAVTNRNSFGRFAIRFQASIYSADIVGNGIFTSYLVAPATGNILVGVQHVSGGTVGTAAITIDDFSVREIPGHPSVSPSAGNGPTATARVNLLQRTEEFDNAAWPKFAANVTPNADVAPNATTTADYIVETSATSEHRVEQAFSSFVSGSTYKLSVRAKAAERTFVRVGFSNLGTLPGRAVFNLSNGTIASTPNGTSSIRSVGNGYYECTVIAVCSSSVSANVEINVMLDATTSSYAGDTSKGLYLWGADLRLSVYDSLNLPAYQRVGDGSAGVFDYDHVGFPVRLTRGAANRGLMTLGTLDLTATDAVNAGMWVVKTSDAAAAVLMESSDVAGANNGAIAVYAPGGGLASQLFVFASRGTEVRYASDTISAAPIVAAVYGRASISGDVCVLSINGVQTAAAIGGQGTGNYGNLRLFEGGRSLDSSPSLSFSGEWLPGFVVDGSVVDASLASEILGEISNSLRVSEVPFVPDIFTPARLFSKNEQGLWIDLNNLSTLYQDSAGTIPVTNVEQPVGLILDRSKGLVLGPELVTNGGPFTTATGWTSSGGATLSVNNGRLRVTGTGANQGAFQTITCEIGKRYRVTATGYLVGPAFNFIIGAAFGQGQEYDSGSTAQTKTFSLSFTAGRVSEVISLYNQGSGSVEWGDISVRELPGNHIIQATSTKRPTLSARYNLLTRTEEFDNAAWTANVAAVAADSTTAPDGTNTADTLTASGAFGNIQQLSTGTGTAFTVSVYAKKAAYDNLEIGLSSNAGYANGCAARFELTNGTYVSQRTFGTGYAVSSYSISSVGSGWYRITVSITITSSATLYYWIGLTASAVNGSSIYLWGADLRLTIDTIGQPEYQRVGAATFGTSTTAGNPDYDTLGFQPYLRFDGTDDSMSTTTSVDFTGTDKMTVFAGVTKLSNQGDAQVIFEIGALGVDNGSVGLLGRNVYVPGVSQFAFVSGGTLSSSAFTASSIYSAPVSGVLSGIGDISSDTAILKINGQQIASSPSDQGTGNFGNYPLFLGARNNASLFFNGRIYSMIIRGASSHPQEIMQTEKWIAERSIQKIPEDYRNLTINNDYLVTAAGDYLYVDRLIQ